MYIVGIEGTGHHGVTPAIETIAKSCHYKVEYGNYGMLMRTRFSNTKRKVASLSNHTKVLFLDDQSFPSRGECRFCTFQQIKNMQLYNLQSLYQQAQKANINIRFLHLSRDFYATVRSHPDIDGSFKQHAQVMQRFLKFINAEYDRIEQNQMGLWVKVYYEWFQELSNCAALVIGITEFSGWSDCNISSACEVLHRNLRNSTIHGTIEGDLAYARSLDSNVSIPVMNYKY